MAFTAGFRCRDGVVLIAQTPSGLAQYQVRWGEKQPTTQSIPWIFADATENCSLMIASAGSLSYSKSAVEDILRLLQSRSQTIYQVAECIREVVQEIFTKEIAALVQDRDREYVEIAMMIGAHMLDTGEVHLLRVEDTTVEFVEDSEFVGRDADLARGLARWFYRSDLRTGEFHRMARYINAAAENLSPGTPPIEIRTVPAGRKLPRPDRVEVLTFEEDRRMAEVAASAAAAFQHCFLADTNDSEFAKHIDALVCELTRIRMHQHASSPGNEPHSGTAKSDKTDAAQATR